jgi:hypothetical protein
VAPVPAPPPPPPDADQLELNPEPLDGDKSPPETGGGVAKEEPAPAQPAAAAEAVASPCYPRKLRARLLEWARRWLLWWVTSGAWSLAICVICTWEVLAAIETDWALCKTAPGQDVVCFSYDLSTFPLPPTLITIVYGVATALLGYRPGPALVAIAVQYALLVAQTASLYRPPGHATEQPTNGSPLPGTGAENVDIVRNSVTTAVGCAFTVLTLRATNARHRRSYALRLSLEAQFSEYDAAVQAWKRTQWALLRSRDAEVRGR